MPEVVTNLIWAVVFALVGGLVRVLLMLAAAVLLPRLIQRMKPDLDEDKELARGNLAVAEYFGRVVAASILGVSLIVAAAVLGGLLAALHGPAESPPPSPSSPAVSSLRE